ncbi:MAG: hypothetical protein ACKVZJ_06095 [Phycisphaerales bacterium]
MKRLIHDIRSAWPRERRFTWRGWVLLGVLASIAAAGWQGWDPVRQLLVVLSLINADWPMAFSRRVLVLVWISSLTIEVSILSIPALTLALGLSRPAVHWGWYVVLIPLALVTSAVEFEILSWLRSIGLMPGVRGFPGWVFYLSVMLKAAIWGELIGRAMRNRWAHAWLLGAAFAAVCLSLALEPARATARGAWIVGWLGFRLSIETVMYQSVLAVGLIWLAFRSWYTRPDHLCPTCNYDRRGLKHNAPCPECGASALAAPPPAPTVPVQPN